METYTNILMFIKTFKSVVRHSSFETTTFKPFRHFSYDHVNEHVNKLRSNVLPRKSKYDKQIAIY